MRLQGGQTLLHRGADVLDIGRRIPLLWRISDLDRALAFLPRHGCVVIVIISNALGRTCVVGSDQLTCRSGYIRVADLPSEGLRDVPCQLLNRVRVLVFDNVRRPSKLLL